MLGEDSSRFSYKNDRDSTYSLLILKIISERGTSECDSKTFLPSSGKNTKTINPSELNILQFHTTNGG